MLLPGNAIIVTHMGQELLLSVEGADAAVDAAQGFMVGKDSAVHVLLGSESMPQPEKPETAEVWRRKWQKNTTPQLNMCAMMSLGQWDTEMHQSENIASVFCTLAVCMLHGAFLMSAHLMGFCSSHATSQS